MNKLIQFFKLNKRKIIFFIFFLINLLILSSSNYKDWGDDLFYKNANLSYSWWNFLVYRYFNWTGRIIPELSAYFFNSSLSFLWPVFNSAILTLLSVLIFNYLNLFIKLKPIKKDLLALIICLSFLLINKNIIAPAFFWRTGSVNYVWPITLGFLAFYPFLLSIKNKLNKKNYLFYFLISLLVSISTEQVLVALFFGISFYFFYMVIKKLKIPLIIYLMILNIFIGSFVLFSAPGNQVRFGIEAANNFPFFSSLRIFNRVSISLYWVLNKMVNVLPMAIAPVYLILGFKNIKNSPKIFSLISIFIGIILIVKSVFGIEYPIQPITSDNFLSLNILIKYIFIISSFSLIPYLIWRSFKFSQKTLIYFSILLVILLLMLMITFSPTLDVSGNRTIFLPSLLFNVLGLFLIFN